MKTLRWLSGMGTATLATLGRRLVGRRRHPTWPLRTELVQQTMHATLTASLRNGVEWFRALQTRGAMPVFFDNVVRFEEEVVGGIPGLWTVPEKQSIDRTILLLHGGGYVFGDPQTYKDLAARLAVGASARVFCPDYRRAPEHPAPAPHDDALAAYRGVLERGPAEELVVVGDSAGGALALSVLLGQRDSGGAMPAAAVLFCPWVDPFGGGASMQANEATDIGPARWIRWCAELAVPADMADDPRVRPMAGDLTGLPPTLVQVGGVEMLHDQGITLAEALESAGVETELHVEPAMFHVWQLLAGQLEQAQEALEQACRFTRDRS